MPIAVGDTFPNVTLTENNPGTKVNTHDLMAGKKVVIFGVPGAFTPGCSKTHLPGYINDAEKIKAKGYSEIICVSVNDPFVMGAWGAQSGADGKVRMLSDTHAELAKALGLELCAQQVFGAIRMKRFSAIVDNKIVTQLNVETDGTGLTCSLSNGLKY